MRSGGCAVQQALAADAAAVVRQAVALARRRGHAQVTPLHVASAMLSAAAGLLRAACLRSHSHPLQCKALELCFNVALNRLPTAAGPGAAMFHHHGGHLLAGYGHHHAPPVLSNALVAAFKRAQAHQRRGALEGHQAPPSPAALAAGKVELEQLIVSILDDPSVSRVMREAGFSSSQVKANVEKAVSSSPPDHGHSTSTTTSSPTSGHAPTLRHANAAAKAVVDDDVVRVLDCMAGDGSKQRRRRAAVVVVGEGAEGVMKAVMDRVSKGELQHHRHDLLRNLQFVPLSAAAFRRMAREEVECRAGELRALVRQGCAAGKGVVLVLEDLAFAADAWAAASNRRTTRGGNDDGHCGYCPVEHGVMEVSGLVSEAGRGLDRFWLLGFGSNQAYIKCRAGQPPLEAVWDLHPVVVPDGGGGGVALSLSCTSEAQQASQERSRTTGWPFTNGAAADGNDLVVARAEAVAEKPNLPQWLRGYQESDQNGPESCSTSLQLQERNSNCNGSAANPTSELTLSFSAPASTTSPAASSIFGFASNHSNLMMNCKPWQFMPMQPLMNHRYDDATANSYDHQTLHADHSPESYSVSNSSEGGAVMKPRFTELTAENLKTLCKALENCVPHHKDVGADIASAVLQCRSGMAKRTTRWHKEKPNVATWFLFHGSDNAGKKAVAQELARLVFGSHTDFTSISLANYAPVHSKSSSGEIVLKRQRSLDSGHGYVQRLYETILENPHRVIMINGVDQLEYDSEISIRNAIKNGRVMNCNGDEISLEDAIVILSSEALDSSSSCFSPRLKQRIIDNEGDQGNDMHIEKGTEPSCFIFDLNACVEDGEGEERGASDNNVRILDVVDGVFFFQLNGGFVI